MNTTTAKEPVEDNTVDKPAVQTSMTKIFEWKEDSEDLDDQINTWLAEWDWVWYPYRIFQLSQPDHKMSEGKASHRIDFGKTLVIFRKEV